MKELSAFRSASYSNRPRTLNTEFSESFMFAPFYVTGYKETGNKIDKESSEIVKNRLQKMDSFTKKIKAGDFQVKKFKKREANKIKKLGGSLLNDYQKEFEESTFGFKDLV